MARTGRPRLVIDRQLILDRCTPEPMTGCWLWLMCCDQNGYGIQYAPPMGEHLAHRVAYRLFRGDIPKGIFVCHACDTPGCVNPDHLFLGTVGDNTRDMIAKGRSWGQKKTACPQGHHYSTENTYICTRGKRQCRTCMKLRDSKRVRKVA